MRISQQMIIGNLTNRIHSGQDNYLSSQEKLSTGKQINRPSDNPISAEMIMEITTKDKDYEQLQENIRYSSDLLDSSEAQISRGISVLQSMRELATTMANDSVNEQDRTDAISAVNQALEEMLSIANSKENGRYLFSGTTDNIEAFDPITYQYNGNNDIREVDIYENLRIDQNIPGSDLFTDTNNGTINVFQALTDFKTALQNNDGDNIQHALTTLEDSREQFSKARTIIGHSNKKLEITQEILSVNQSINTTARADLEDVDIAKESSNLSKYQQILEANYALVGKTQNLSILKYL
jgi:flagellar hook-associated protein 3 FlgL